MHRFSPTPTSRSKGQKSRGGGILCRPPSCTACYICAVMFISLSDLGDVCLILAGDTLHNVSLLAIAAIFFTE